MKNQALFQKNLALISQLYPNYSSYITSFPDSGKYTVQPKEQSVFLCNITNDKGTEWVHGPDNPWGDAERIIKQSDWQTASTFIIMRAGLGYVPHTLYLNLRKGRHAQRMLIIEDNIELFRESLYLFDWTDVLRSDRTILILQENPVPACVSFFQTNPVSLLPVISVICGVNIGADEKRMMDELQGHLAPLAQTVSNASNTYLQEIQQHYQTVKDDPNHKTKVVQVEPEHDYLANSVAEGFQQNGCETEMFAGNMRMIHFLKPYAWLLYTREHFPDILLWMNRCTLSPEGESHLKQLPIHKVLWFLDSPKRVETTKEEIEAVDAIFTFDASYIPYLKELGGKECHYLPTAAGIHPLPENMPDQIRKPRTGSDVGFLGSLAASRYQSVREFWQGRDPEFVTILDGIVEDYLADRTVSLEERYNQSPGRERLEYQGHVVLYLEERATYMHRLRTLQQVKEYGLKTYGSPEWGNSQWAEDLVSCYAGYAPKYEEELPGVYFNTKININAFHVQCENSTNPRIYDVLAAGGFLLTEYRPAIEDELEDGKHLVWYKSLDELKEKTEYYLAHEDEREAIALEGQKFVLEHATYKARVKKILGILET